MGRKMEETRDQLIERLNQRTYTLGRAKLNEEIAKAEGLKLAQEVLDLTNKIHTMKQDPVSDVVALEKGPIESVEAVPV